MPCGTCVGKLAKQLMANHKIDMILALERAEDAVERYEQRAKPQQKSMEQRVKESLEILGFDPDYSVECTSGGTCGCKTSGSCAASFQCLTDNFCTCECPEPPKEHSHYVEDTCDPLALENCNCTGGRCRTGGSCSCSCVGLCWYDCDEGYEWNAETEQCEETGAAGQQLFTLIIEGY